MPPSFLCQLKFQCVKRCYEFFLCSRFARKHLTGGFLCSVLDLSGILWSLLIQELRGEAHLEGLRNPGMFFVSFSIR